MSKKLIAVASAAALALTALVAVPANAATISSVTVTHSGSTAGEALTSHTDADSAVKAATWASARNVVFGTDAASYSATRTAVRFAVLTTDSSSVVVTATGGVKLATAVSVAGVALKVDAGSTTLTGATTAGSSTTLTYTFYAWSTNTTAGKVVIETPGSKNTYYVMGTEGPAYNLASVTFPTSLTTGQTDGKLTYTLSDAYGNLIADGTKLTPTGFGSGTNGAATWNATTKVYSSTLGTVTDANVALSITLPAFDGVDYTTVGFPKRVSTAFKLVSAADLATQVTTLTAQVATLTASVSALTADYNSVAKKYNKLVKKSKRVALK
jgi:7-cyano-7-deazaguanine synthase in queuosine biosynthesis